jgi:transcriptional regulator with AAA-type ATPase domain
MKVPIFKHTSDRISALLEDESQPLKAISEHSRHDPGMLFSVLIECSSRQGSSEVTTISQAVSLMGSNALKDIIAGLGLRLEDPNSLLLWHCAVLSGEAATLVNEKANIADPEEAYFAAVLPSVGMLLMLQAKPEYQKLIPLLAKLSIEDRVFLENRLFNINHVSILDSALSLPQKYRDIIKLIKIDRFPSALRVPEQNAASRFTAAYEASQLYHLSTSAENMAQAILFPFVVLAEDNFKRINKRFFRIAENETEELLTATLERYEAVCKNYALEETASALIAEAVEYTVPESKFLTVSAPLLRVLNELFAERHVERNILISGEAGVGKRLLAKALHYHPANPRRMKPFLSFHCDTVERDTLEEELLGQRGGYWGADQHKGAFDIANGGTIMLKDIQKMPLQLQEKLADIISKIDYYRSRKIQSDNPDVIFIVTSRQNLEEEAAQGRFSKMLLRALKPVTIEIPPLRERRDDIGFIADGIIKKYKLPLQDTTMLLGLQELYETENFQENLSDLKRLLFYIAAKQMLKS